MNTKIRIEMDTSHSSIAFRSCSSHSSSLLAWIRINFISFVNNRQEYPILIAVSCLSPVMIHTLIPACSFTIDQKKFFSIKKKKNQQWKMYTLKSTTKDKPTTRKWNKKRETSRRYWILSGTFGPKRSSMAVAPNKINCCSISCCNFSTF